MQLLFDFDNFLREVLLVAQCSGGGENLPDKGRHRGGESVELCVGVKQIGRRQQLSRAECTSRPLCCASQGPAPLSAPDMSL